MTHLKLSMPVRPLAALALCLVALGCTAPDQPSENVVAAAPAALWVNGDFESNTTPNVPPTGWTIEARRNLGIIDTRPGPQTLASLNLQSGGVANTVIMRGAPESQSDTHLGAGASLRFPRYGNSVAVVNYNSASTATGMLGDQYNANIMRQTMTVALGDIDPIDNAVHVRFAIAPVLQNPSHPYNQQPYYYVELRNITRSNAILYQDFNTSAQTGVPWKISNSIYYTDWQLVDISPGNSLLAVGDQVELVVVAAGCSQSGHWGRVYVDGVNATIPGIYTWATGPAAANAGSTITYTVNYRNGGSAPTTNTFLAFETPPGTNFNSVSLGAACTNPGVGNAGVVNCTLGTLAPGASGSYTVTVNVPVLTAVGTVLTAGNYFIDADVVSPLLGPKVQTTVTALVAYADVSVTKTDNSAARGLGTPTSYTIVVSNAGPSAATNVQVVDTMPAQLTGVTWTCTPSALATCTGSGSGNINQTVTIPSGGNVTYTVNATIVSSGATSVSNTATATVNTQSDPSTSNNSATDTTALGALRTLSVTKTGALGGSIVSTPAAINCGTSCSSASAQFLDGSTVILTAAAVPNATFVGWGGACSGTATTCTLTLSSDTNVSATFLPPPFISINGGGTQSTVVNTAFPTPLSVRVADANDNPIPNATVTFTVPGSGASATLSTLTATTNAMGIATVTATANTVSGTYNVAANVSGAAAPLSFALTNSPGPAATVTVSGGGVQSTTVNTAFGAPFQVRVLDSFGNPRVGDTVTYTRPTSGPNVTLSSATAITNATGYASVTGTASTESGAYVLSATTASLTPATFNLTNNAGAVTLVTQTGEPQSVQVGQMFGSGLGIILRDQYGNGVPGITVSYVANGTTANATLSASSSVTNASGIAAVTATANNVTGSYTVTATIPGQGTRTWNLTNTPGPVTQVTQTGTPQSATVATAYAAPLVLTLRDALNNPVPGVTITYTTSGTPTTPNVTLSQSSVTTNAAGTASITASANNFAGTVTVTATIPGVGTRTFTLNNTPGAPAAVAQTGTPQSATVGTAYASPLGLVVTDALGNPIQGLNITYTTSGVGGANVGLSATSVTTNASGAASVTATANNTAGAVTVTATIPGIGTRTFSLTNTPGAVTQVTQTGTPQSQTVGGNAYGQALVLTLRDALNNPVPGVTITYTTVGVGGANVSLSATSVTTNAAGTASVTATTNNTAGAVTVTATIPGVGTRTFSLTNTPGAAAQASQSGTPQSATVATAYGSPLALTITDAFGNPVPGVNITYTTAGTGGANVALSATTATTNSSGVASITATANNTAGPVTVTATIPGVGTRTFSLTNTPGAATQVAQTGTPQSQTVGGNAYAQPLELTLRDALNNPVPGVTITYSTSGTSTTPNVSLSSGSVTTNASGVASVTATSNNFAGPVTVTATIPGIGTRTFALTNTPGAATQVAQTGTPQSATVATAYASPLSLTLRDALNNPVPGVTITYTTAGTGGANVGLSATSVTTNASGVANVTATANNVAGPVTVTATIPGIGTRTFSLTNAPGAVASVVQGGTPQSATVGTAYGSPLSLTLRDALNNPVPGVTITYTTAGTGGADVNLSSASATTNASGVASITAAANNVAGPITVTATIPGVGTRTFALTNTPGAASQVAQSGTPQSQTVGGIAYGAPLSLTLRDALDNPVPGVTITYTTAGTGGANVALSATSATTDASGNASITATSNNLAGLVTVTATIPGIGTRTFALTNTPDVAANLVVHDGGTQSAEVSTEFATALSVRVTDQFGNVRAGDTVTFALPVSTANATLSSTTAVTDASGIAQVTATANTTAGSYTVTASSGSLGPVSFDLTNTPGVPYSAIADSGASQTTIVNTAFTDALSLTVRDQYGNPLPGVTVTLTVPGADASAILSATTVTTDANGQISVTATANTVAGSYDVEASIAGIATPTVFALTNTHDAPANLVVTGGDDQSATVDVAFATALEVRITDQFGNPISGETVTFSAPGTGASAVLSGTSVTTDADGRASITAQANTTAGTYDITASSGALTPVEFSLENDASAASSADADSGASQSTVVDTAFGEPLALTVRDAFGNPLEGITVTFTVPSADASAVLTTLTAVTDVNGRVSVPATANTVAGPYTVEASVPGIATPTVFSLTNTPDVPAHLDIVEGDDQSAVVDEAFPTALTVRITDQFGNPISGESVTFAAPAADASAVLSGTTVTTDVDGRASVTAQANTVAGTYDVTVSSGVLSPVQFSLENEVSVPSTITIDSGASQMAVVGEAFSEPLTLTVRDAFGNVLPGVTVTFTVPSTDASATLTTMTATTDENGQVTVNATANTVAGVYEVEARVDGITDPAIFTLANLVSAPSRISVLGGGEQDAVVDTDFAEPLSVLVTDENDNPVANVEVTFTVPSSDATAVLTTLTATTDANGHATVNAKAGTIVGAYQVTAATAFSTTPATFELSNTPGAAATITPNPGSSPQSAQVGTPFTNPLAVTVVDAFGNPVPGVTVTFTVPASGPTAEVTTVTVTTDENGVASLPASASMQAGAYVVTATTAGVQDPATFELENLVGTPATISIVSGGEQSTLATTPFGEAIVVEVLDVYGNPVPGAVIDITLPTSGASATGSAAQIVTDENGIARIELVANAVAGTYTVSISVENGDAPVVATLTNETVSTTLTLTTEHDHALLGGRFEVTATVTSPTGTPTGIVRFFAGETELGEAVLDENGVAVFRIDASVIGEMQIHAEYIADLPFVSTTSEPITLTVEGGAVFGGAVCSATPGQTGTSILPLALLGLAIVLVRRRAVRS